MTKIRFDADGDIPPSNIINNWKSVVEFELYKQVKFESQPWKGRKSKCACHYFEGRIPGTHKCYTLQKVAFLTRVKFWLARRFNCVQNLKN
jgi:hypothetical protein